MRIPGLSRVAPGFFRFLVALPVIVVGASQAESAASARSLAVLAPTTENLPPADVARAERAQANPAVSEPHVSGRVALETALRLDRLASNPKLMAAQFVLAPLSRGENETAVIVTLAPTATAQDLAAQSEHDPHRSASFDQLDAPLYFDLQDPAIRGQLRDTVTQRVGQFIADNQAPGLSITQRFSYQFGFAARVNPAALEQLLADPAVLRVEEDGPLEPHLRQGIPLMQADTPSATFDGSGVSIAIVDTGIDTSHPRLGGGSGIFNTKVIGGFDTGDNDADPRPNPSTGNAHGTACAGIAAGDVGDAGDYIGGVAPGATLYALKITAGDGGSASSSAMIAAWEWAVTHQYDDPANPILIVSTSFGGGGYSASCDSEVPAMTTAAANAVAAGITLFASSGNDGFCSYIEWPACISHVNSVGAVYDANIGSGFGFCVDSASCVGELYPFCLSGYAAWEETGTDADRVTVYSNSASFLTLFAPSHNAYTTDISGSGGYASGDYEEAFGGTSAACPYAAGAAAVLQSAAKAKSGDFLTPAQVRSYLTSYGTTITDGKVPSVQKPRINLASAVEALPESQPTVTVTATDATASEAGLSTGTFTFRRTGGTSAALTVYYSVSGTAIPGSDYLNLGTSISFAADASTATLTVTPLSDSLVEPDESIVLSLAEGDGYQVDTPASATVILTSDEAVAGGHVGVYDPIASTYFLSQEHAAGAADIVYGFGPAGAGWYPLSGDWNADGRDTAGLWDPATATFFLRDVHAAGGADQVFDFGPAHSGWLPLVGDWNGDGMATVGLYDPASSTFFLRNLHAGGAADHVFTFGPAGAGWLPLAGDWNGDGVTTIGLYDPLSGTFYLRNVHAGGAADLVFGFGPGGLGWKPLGGDWDGDGASSVGLYDPLGSVFFLHNAHAGGEADLVYALGPANAGWWPLSGQW